MASGAGRIGSVARPRRRRPGAVALAGSYRSPGRLPRAESSAAALSAGLGSGGEIDLEICVRQDDRAYVPPDHHRALVEQWSARRCSFTARRRPDAPRRRTRWRPPQGAQVPGNVFPVQEHGVLASIDHRRTGHHQARPGAPGRPGRGVLDVPRPGAGPAGQRPGTVPHCPHRHRPRRARATPRLDLPDAAGPSMAMIRPGIATGSCGAGWGEVMPGAVPGQRRRSGRSRPRSGGAIAQGATTPGAPLRRAGGRSAALGGRWRRTCA